MAAKRKAITPADRVAEYIDSPLMTKRLRYGNELSARIHGNYGVYRTQVKIGRSTNASCSCPSDYWPCKHVQALEATWEVNPDSFLDLESVLKTFGTKTKPELLKLIAKMAMLAPESLSACGIEGFENDEDGSEFD